MAAALRSLFAIGGKIVLQKHIRSLYSASSLGIDNYLVVRKRVEQQFENVQDKFRERMKKYLETPNQSMVFTEDIKNFVHLLEKKEDDFKLLEEMLRRFNQQNKNMRFGTFVFGPVIMRTFHYLKCPELAFKLLKDPMFDGFFDQIASFHIMMDSLFCNEKYHEVLDVFKVLQDRQLFGSKYPKDCVVLAFAACYKLNDKEAFDFTVKLLQGIREAGSSILRRGLAFAAALAINQNNPAMALEILCLTNQFNYVTIRNLRLMALSDLDRLDDVIPILQAVMRQDFPDAKDKRAEIFPETIEKIKEAVQRSGSKVHLVEFQRIEQSLKESKNLATESFDSVLCFEIPPRQNALLNRFQNTGPANNFRRSSQSNYQPRYRIRKGLNDYDE